MVVCPEHMIALTDSKAYIRNVRYPYYLDATQFTERKNLTSLKVNNEHMYKALLLGSRCNEILNMTDKDWIDEKLFPHYRREAIKLGYVCKSNYVDSTNLENDFEQYWEISFLEFIFGGKKCKNYSWLKTAFRENHKSLHTYHHILIQLFLESFR